MKTNTCDCSHHKILPIIALLFSILFLMGYCGYVSESFVNFGWPVLVGLAALTKLGEHDCRCC